MGLKHSVAIGAWLCFLCVAFSDVHATEIQVTYSSIKMPKCKLTKLSGSGSKTLYKMKCKGIPKTIQMEGHVRSKDLYNLTSKSAYGIGNGLSWILKMMTKGGMFRQAANAVASLSKKKIFHLCVDNENGFFIKGVIPLDKMPKSTRIGKALYGMTKYAKKMMPGFNGNPELEIIPGFSNQEASLTLKFTPMQACVESKIGAARFKFNKVALTLAIKAGTGGVSIGAGAEGQLYFKPTSLDPWLLLNPAYEFGFTTDGVSLTLKGKLAGACKASCANTCGCTNVTCSDNWNPLGMGVVKVNQAILEVGSDIPISTAGIPIPSVTFAYNDATLFGAVKATGGMAFDYGAKAFGFAFRIARGQKIKLGKLLRAVAGKKFTKLLSKIPVDKIPVENLVWSFSTAGLAIGKMTINPGLEYKGVMSFQGLRGSILINLELGNSPPTLETLKNGKYFSNTLLPGPPNGKFAFSIDGRQLVRELLRAVGSVLGSTGRKVMKKAIEKGVLLPKKLVVSLENKSEKTKGSTEFLFSFKGKDHKLRFGISVGFLPHQLARKAVHKLWEKLKGPLGKAIKETKKFALRVLGLDKLPTVRCPQVTRPASWKCTLQMRVHEERWLGTAPACGNARKNCIQAGGSTLRSDKSGDGKRCTTGNKMLCLLKKQCSLPAPCSVIQTRGPWFLGATKKKRTSGGTVYLKDSFLLPWKRKGIRLFYFVGGQVRIGSKRSTHCAGAKSLRVRSDITIQRCGIKPHLQRFVFQGNRSRISSKTLRNLRYKNLFADGRYIPARKLRKGMNVRGYGVITRVWVSRSRVAFRYKSQQPSLGQIRLRGKNLCWRFDSAKRNANLRLARCNARDQNQLFTVPSQKPKAPGNFVRKLHLDIPGNDLGKALYFRHWQQCQSACFKHKKCRAFVFHTKGNRNRYQECRLKHFVAKRVPYAHAMAGVSRALAKPAPQAQGQFKRRPGYDFEGHDIGKHPQKLEHWQQCQNLCHKHRRCVAYTYYPKGKKRGDCWLKHKVGAKKPKADALTAARFSARAPRRIGYFTYERGYDYFGNDIGEHPRRLQYWQQCENACHKNRRCKAYTFFTVGPEKGRCFLKSRGRRSKRDRRTITGKRLKAPKTITGYRGCFKYRSKPRSFVKYGQTPPSCVAACQTRHFPYALLFGDGDCYCSRALRAPKVDDISCKRRCRGDKSYRCGGSVTSREKYTAAYETKSLKAAQAALKGHVGCFKTRAGASSVMKYHKDLSSARGAGGSDPAICVALCKKSRKAYAGLKFPRLCYCGDQPDDFGKAPERDCNHKCPGAPTKSCGALPKSKLHHKRISVYRTGLKPAPMASLMLGCFSKSSLRKRKFQKLLTPKVSIKSCLRRCKTVRVRGGYPSEVAAYVGRECWCGQSFAGWSRARHCSSSTARVYSLVKVGVGRHGSSYIGCFSGNAGLNKSVPIERSRLRIQTCIWACKRKNASYAGLHRNRCSCGSRLSSRDGIRQKHCHAKCSGSPSEHCGSKTASSVFSTGIAPVPRLKGTFTRFSGYTSSGNDIYSRPKQRTHWQECQNLCHATKRCLAYSFIKTGAVGGKCYLKHRRGRKKTLRASTYGVRKAAPKARGTFTPKRGFSYAYGVLKQIKGFEHWQACQNACFKEKRCKVFSFDTRRSSCVLRFVIQRERRNKHVISGIRRTPKPKGIFILHKRRAYPGNDLKTIPKVYSWQACQNACYKERRCQLFTHHLLGGVCKLKYKAGKHSPYRDHYISGVRSTKLRNNFHKLSLGGWQFTGHKLKTLKGFATWQNCQRACDRHKRCVVYSFEVKASKCELMSGLGKPTYKGIGDVYSGIRRSQRGFRVQKYKRVQGKLLEHIKVNHSKICEDRCLKERRCVAFTYRCNYKWSGKHCGGRECKLLRSTGKSIGDKHALTGIRVRQAKKPKARRMVRRRSKKPKTSKKFAAYLGCYYDKKKRAMPFRARTPSRFGFTRPQQCISICKKKGYRYAGMQAGNQCWCGNSYGKYGKAPEAQCKKCRRHMLKCGGGWRNSVYKAKK